MKKKIIFCLLLCLAVSGNFAEFLYGGEKATQSLETKTYALNYASSKIVKEKVLELMESLSSEEIDFCYIGHEVNKKDLTKALLLHKGRKIYIDVRTNSLIIADAPFNQKLINKLIGELDKPRQNFLIKFIQVFLPTKEAEKAYGERWGGSYSEAKVHALEGVSAKISMGNGSWSSCYEVTPVLRKEGEISLMINYKIKQEGKIPMSGYYPDSIFKDKEIKLFNTFIVPGVEKEGIKEEMACGILVYVEKIGLEKN